ncbi:MAG: DEAD/DEAH box helicase, partial [Desulfatiglandales bacterium]
LRTDLVILDEAHYLSDPDRGVVWEEVMIYLPPRIRLILLSATIPNASQLSSWLELIRGSPVKVIRSTERPVPLKLLYYDPRGTVIPLANRKGLANRVLKSDKELRKYRPNFGELIKDMRDLNLLPAIFFLKSREDCDKALLHCPETKGDADIKESMKRELEIFLQAHPHLASHRQLKTLMRSRVASHHAGQLPSWKLLVERMMNL